MKIFKKVLCLFIILGQLVVLASCLNDYNEEPQKGKVLQSINFNYFNTVSYIYSYAGHEHDVFTDNSNKAFELFGEYHQLFDIYYEYSGINNLCTVNKKAGVEAVEVDQKLIDFLIYTKEVYTLTSGETTSATTLAPEIVGAPTVTLPLLSINNTLSNSILAPCSASKW